MLDRYLPRNFIYCVVVLAASVVVTVASALFPLSSAVAGSGDKDVKSKKSELSKIRVELDETQKRLDSLRGSESKLLNKLKDLDERIELDRQVIKKVNGKLGRLRKKKAEAKTQLQERRALLASRKDRFRRDMRAFYLREFNVIPAPQGAGNLQGGDNPQVADNPLGQIDIPAANDWQTAYFNSIGALRRHEVGVSSDLAHSAESQLGAVSKSERDVERLKKKRVAGASLRESQRDLSKRKLGKVRKDKESVADRLLYLSEEAKQMNELVARLEARERERNARQRTSPETNMTGLFVAQKGRLKPPLAGKIVSPFGWATDPVSNLKTFSSGVEIKGKPNYNVRAVAEGTVAYIGSLHGYGKFVIVAHDDGFYTTYGGLARVKVTLDQVIAARTAVGVTATGMVKFEIRHGKESVDPVSWLNFGALR